jgi:CRP-like cAMP-binding protein
MDHKLLEDGIKRFSRNLTDEDVSLLISCAEYRKLKKGEIILKEGKLCRAFYLVEKGYLRTYSTKDDTDINLNFTFEGEFTTNFKSIQLREGSEFNIEAGEPASVWVMDLDLMLKYFDGHVQINLFVRRLAVRILLASEEHSNLFKIYTPTERYRYIEKNNPKLLQRVSLSQLASYLGVTRETLSRIRGKNN